MKLNIILFVGAAIGAISLAAPLASQGSKDGALDAACRSTEVTAPDSCPCTITSARKAGLNDTELASLFKDDGHSQPVDQAKYGRFWQVKSQCIADATMAKMGITPGNPLPGVPANMRPGMPFPPADTPVPPIARPAPVAAAAAPSAPAAPAATEPERSTVADLEAMFALLRGNAYEYTETDGSTHRYDFMPDGDLMLYQREDPGASPGYRRYVTLSKLSAQDFRYGALAVLRDVATGGHSTFDIISAANDHFLFNKSYVRTNEEWRFRKVGAANARLPEDAPQPLADGFWQVRFDRKLDKSAPFFNENHRLIGWTSASNREAYLEDIAVGGGLIQIKHTDNPDCAHNCILVINDWDPRTRQARGRLIEEVGIDSVGVRPEATTYGAYERVTPNRVSVRAYDGYGGFTEWLCTDTPRQACRKTGEQAPPAAATVSTAGLAGRLGAVTGAVYGEAQCSSDYYLAPADRAMLRSANTLDGYVRTNRGSLIATQVDVRGSDMPGLKLKIDGRERVLPATGDQSWGAGGIRFVFRSVGEAIYDNPAYGFTPGTATLTIDGQTQTIDLIGNGAC